MRKSQRASSHAPSSQLSIVVGYRNVEVTNRTWSGRRLTDRNEYVLKDREVQVY